VGTTCGDSYFGQGGEEEATPHHASTVMRQKVLSGDSKDEEMPLLSERPSHVNRVLAPVSAILKRNFDLMEAHPLDSLFCRYCGNFFACSDGTRRTGPLGPSFRRK
jgi:hypothetical protein